MAGERFKWDLKKLKIVDVQPQHFPEKQQEVYTSLVTLSGRRRRMVAI